mgnify:CR=1 FL=1
MSYFLLEENTKTLLPDEAHHIIKVLRMKIGDIIEATDGQGNVYKGQISSTEPFGIDILSNTHLESPKIRIRVIISAIKIPLLELIIQKLTEIGIDEIIITHTDFSQISLKNIIPKWERFKTIILTACKQSERVYFPEIRIQSLSEIVYSSDSLNIIGNTQYTIRDTIPITHLNIQEVSSINLFIGPEGGFSEQEYTRLIENHQYIPIQLTPHILRSETAAIVGGGIIKMLSTV